MSQKDVPDPPPPKDDDPKDDPKDDADDKDNIIELNRYRNVNKNDVEATKKFVTGKLKDTKAPNYLGETIQGSSDC